MVHGSCSTGRGMRRDARHHGVTHRSEPLLVRVGWLRLTSRDAWGGRRHVSAPQPPPGTPQNHLPLITARLQTPRDGLASWGAPGAAAGAPLGAAAGRAGRVSSADPGRLNTVQNCTRSVLSNTLTAQSPIVMGPLTSCPRRWDAAQGSPWPCSGDGGRFLLARHGLTLAVPHT